MTIISDWSIKYIKSAVIHRPISSVVTSSSIPVKLTITIFGSHEVSILNVLLLLITK